MYVLIILTKINKWNNHKLCCTYQQKTTYVLGISLDSTVFKTHGPRFDTVFCLKNSFRHGFYQKNHFLPSETQMKQTIFSACDHNLVAIYINWLFENFEWRSFYYFLFFIDGSINDLQQLVLCNVTFKIVIRSLFQRKIRNACLIFIFCP